MNLLSGLSAFFKSTLITKASSLIAQLVLGFYLSQEDFGIYGIVLSLTVFTNCFGIGIIQKVLIFKVILVFILSTVAILSLPILIDKGNIHFKHALEWNYFIGVILFYLFSRFLWKR